MSICHSTGVVVVQCCQTGKSHNVKDLAPLTLDDLVHGSMLIMDYKGMPFPVEFLEYKAGTVINNIIYNNIKKNSL